MATDRPDRKTGSTSRLRAERAATRPFGQRSLEHLADTPEDHLFDERTLRSDQIVARYRLIYSLCGLVLGLVCILGGIVLFLQGVTGATS